MANYYVSSTGWTAVAAWQASKAYVVGDFVRQLATPTVGNERVFRCTTAGTSATTEPTWVLTRGSTTTSGGAVFTEITGQEAYQVAGSWRPYARLNTAIANGANSDVFYVAATHAETQASAMTFVGNTSLTAPSSVYCVDGTATGHVPPTGADLRTTATISTTGAFSITLNSYLNEVYGITFSAGSGAVTANLIMSNNNTSFMKFTACTLKLAGTSGGTLSLGATGVTANQVILENTSLVLSSSAQSIVAGARVLWSGTTSAISGTLPTTVFVVSNTNFMYFEGLDFSAAGAGKTLIGGATGNSGTDCTLKNCLLGAGVTVAAAASPGGTRVNVINCDSGLSYYRNEKYWYEGTLTTDPTVTRTGGAVDNATSISHKIVTASTVAWPRPFEGFPVAIYNSTTAATVTVTIYGIVNDAVLPKNDEFWVRTAYLGSATSPIATINSGTKANYLATGTALTADTSAWDANVTARANSQAYTVGQTIKVASNPGRVFFCTVAGTSAASEPTGYAAAVDGGTVSDGTTAVFRAGVRFAQAVALSSPTPQAAGLITVTPRAAKASTTYYFDPELVLS